MGGAHAAGQAENVLRPIMSQATIKCAYGIELVELADFVKLDGIIVPHTTCAIHEPSKLMALLKAGDVFIDVQIGDRPQRRPGERPLLEPIASAGGRRSSGTGAGAR